MTAEKRMKKSCANKPAAKKTVVSKAPAGKKASAKQVAVSTASAGRKATAKKRAVKKPAKDSAKASRPAGSRKAGARAGEGGAAKKFKSGQRERFRKALLALRDRLTGQISSLKNDSLTREDSTNLQEDGTDAFERQVALNLVTSEHEAVFQIDEALRRLEEGQYGVCESCGCLVEIPRLEALPFVRMCVQCQLEQERGGASVRPFGARRGHRGL